MHFGHQLFIVNCDDRIPLVHNPADESGALFSVHGDFEVSVFNCQNPIEEFEILLIRRQEPALFIRVPVSNQKTVPIHNETVAFFLDLQGGNNLLNVIHHKVD